MKLLKAIKSTFEAIGMATFIFVFYAYFDKPSGDVLLEYLLTSVGISVFLVWIVNKSYRYMAEHFEIEECPYCGAELDYEEVTDTNHSYICSMGVDEMGKFLMKWGLACIKNEEPEDVFEWLESERVKELRKDEE